MKKNSVLWICVVLMTVFGMSSCSNDDVNTDLWGTWSVVGYGNDQDFHTGENIVNTTRLTFHPDGTFDGNIWPNEAYGTYVRQGDLFSFTEICSTKLCGLESGKPNRTRYFLALNSDCITMPRIMSSLSRSTDWY